MKAKGDKTQCQGSVSSANITSRSEPDERRQYLNIMGLVGLAEGELMLNVKMLTVINSSP